ncbi:MAG: hypothetical protein JKY32_07740 [Rhizobiales bacterium]|nr:hypothetical protein [Hyphomicrobiales bacterium]
MPAAVPVEGYPSKTTAVTGLTERGYNDVEIAHLLQTSIAAIAALQANVKRRNSCKIVSLRLTNDEYDDLSQQAKSEGWSLTDEIKARCFNTDYLDPVDT